MSQPIAFVSNAAGFAGPGAVLGLLQGGFQVWAQDASFADPAVSETYAAGRADVHLLSESDPAQLVKTVVAAAGRIDALVSNDHYPAPPHLPHDAPASELTANLDTLITAPFQLIQAALPQLKAQGGGNIVMVTSNRTNLPLSGGGFADAARAGVNALLKSLARDLAADQITVNAVAPNFLYSEAYYPKAIYEQTELGRAYVRQNVPAGRLGDPSEIGEVIHFLASAKTRFMTGAILEFSGGWPWAGARPEL